MKTLTIAIPAYNMEWCLEKNLLTYCSETLRGRLQVIVLNNASEDATREIAERLRADHPDIFLVANRDSRGYGSSINEALRMAEGKFFRVVDADDWVDTGELERFVSELEACEADIVQTDYTIEYMIQETSVPVTAAEKGAAYNEVYRDFYWPIRTLPSIYSTTYKTELLRTFGFSMQDKVFFVDEEYITIPFLYAKDVVYLDANVYHYLVQNPSQSTSPKNRGKYASHREAVLKRLLKIYTEEKNRKDRPENLAQEYFYERVRRGVADHFTTLYIYVEDRRSGRSMGAEWRRYIADVAPEMACDRKRRILYFMNILGVTPERYVALKANILRFLPGK